MLKDAIQGWLEVAREQEGEKKLQRPGLGILHGLLYYIHVL